MVDSQPSLYGCQLIVSAYMGERQTEQGRTLLLGRRDFCGRKDFLLQVLDGGIGEVDLDCGDTFRVAEAYGSHEDVIAL